MKKLDKYVGRVVRVNDWALRNIKGIRRQSDALDSHFIVAAVSRESRKLICYGANMRIAVGAADVSLI